jgi:hypothetical protein
MKSSDLNEVVNELVRDIREEIKESDYGLLKLVGIELIPFAMGATLGCVGRITGEHWIPALPVIKLETVSDLIHGTLYIHPVRGLWNLTKYGVGVALPYVDKIYLTLQ